MHALRLVCCLGLGKRLLTFLLVGTMLAWGTGVSVSVPNFKDTSVPFPCQDHGCSCRNARSCWNHCCCQTRAQKLAWAEKQGVTPPDYFLAERSETKKTSSEFCGERLPILVRLESGGAVCAVADRAVAKAPNPVPSGKRGQDGGCGSCGGGHVHAAEEADDSLPLCPFSVANDFRCHGVSSVELFFTPVLELKPHCNSLEVLPGQRQAAAALLVPPSWDTPPEPPPPRV